MKKGRIHLSWPTIVLMMVTCISIAGVFSVLCLPEPPLSTPIITIKPKIDRDWDEYWEGVSQFHWLTKPSVCILPGQSIRDVVSWIADGKGQEEMGRLTLAIANGVDPDLRWPHGACFATPKELVNGLDLPDQLEGIGALTEGHCPDEYISLLRRMVNAGDVDVPRFRWFYPDLKIAIEPGQIPARTMQPGQIICIPGAPEVIIK